MRFIVMHKTNPRWESGAIPSRELIARVGSLLGEMAKAGVLLGAEGLRASSLGVRLRFSGGTRSEREGPFEGDDERPSGFSLLRVESRGEAVEWASRQAALLGDVEIDVRPVTEPWDIGMVPEPEGVSARRYMALRKAAASEAGAPMAHERRAALARLDEESARDGVHLSTETVRPGRRGRRYRNSRDGVRVTDGPFTESKELIAGYVILSAASLHEAGRWAARYLEAVEAEEVDLHELEETPWGVATPVRSSA